MVNATKVAIHNKAGALLTPRFDLGTLWPSGPCTGNAGDPVVLYDEIANRWLLSQFATPNHLCFAISQTASPLGSYPPIHVQRRIVPRLLQGRRLAQRLLRLRQRVDLHVLRVQSDEDARRQPDCELRQFTGQTNFLLPADVDGPTSPPAGGGLFYTFKDNSFHGGADRIELFRLQPNFATPASSTFTLIKTFPVTPFTYTVCGFFVLSCIDQQGTTQRVDAAELAALQRHQGETLLDYLDAIYRRYGYYANLGTSMVMTGAEGTVQIQAIQQGLRQHAPTAVAGWAVTQTVDHWDENGIHGRFVSETDRASRNVLAFRLANGARVIVRPSGTEPKNKVYIEVPAPPVGQQAGREALARCKAETDAMAQRIADDFTRQMLARIDVHLPHYALRISGLVPLDKRLDFVAHFMPAFEERAAALGQGSLGQEEVGRWIDTQLASYGKDARGLVREAVMTYVRTECEQAEQLGGADAAPRQQRLKAMERVFCTP